MIADHIIIYRMWSAKIDRQNDIFLKVPVPLSLSIGRFPIVSNLRNKDI